MAEIMSLVAIFVSVFALSVSTRQARAAEAAAESSKSQAGSAAIDAKLPTLMELLREYRSKDCTRMRHYVRSRLLQDHPPNGAGMEAIPQEKVGRYGVVDPASPSSEPRTTPFALKGIVEKPLPENAPSEILRVEGAVATNLNPALKGIRKLMLPRVEIKR